MISQNFKIEAIFPFNYKKRVSELLAHTRYSSVSIRRTMDKGGEKQVIVYAWEAKTNELCDSLTFSIIDILKESNKIDRNSYCIVKMYPSHIKIPLASITDKVVPV